MKMLLALISIIAFLIVDCRDVHDGRERRKSAVEPVGREQHESVDKVQNQDSDFRDRRDTRQFPGKNQTVTTPVDVIDENLSTKIIDNILEEVFAKQTDAASPDGDEDGYAGDHDSNSAAVTFESFTTKKSEDQHTCKKNRRCSKKGGECLPSCRSIDLIPNARCSKKCSCCASPATEESTKLTIVDEKQNRRVGQPKTTYTGPCPPGFERIENCCYWFSSDRGLNTDWDNSRTICQALGDAIGIDVDLADFGYERCCTSHVPLMEEIARKGAGPAWLGATDASSENDWTWAHSGRSLSIMDPFWANDEPNQGTSANCLAAWVYGAYGRAYFADDSCSDDIAFVCQIF